MYRAPLGRILAFAGLCLVSMLLLVGCSFPWQHSSSTSSPSTTNIPKPTAQQLLATFQKNFRTVTAFHIVMQLSHSGTVSDNQIQIRHADGDVGLPDKIKAQATVILNGQSVVVNLIGIGATQYITDPISGQWRTIKGLIDIRSLTNPDSGLISLVSKLQSLSDPTDDSVNGVPCWRISGQLDAKYLAFLTGGGVPAGTLLQTSACLGKTDSLPYEVKLTGQAATGDTSDTTRSFEITNYNENISITAPQV